MTDDTDGREYTREETTEGPAFRGRRSTTKPANSPFLSAPATSLIDPVSELEKEPRILDKFAADVQRSGLVGEERAAKILFLALTSRLLKRPVSVAVKGASSAGKSNLVNQVLKFFPQEAYYTLTATSPKALVYSQEPVSRRFLVYFEAAGFQDKHGAYFLRSILSEGELRYETTVWENNRRRQHLIVRPGPTGLILTSTQNLEGELETRLLSIHVDESTPQTRRVLLASANEDDVDVALDKWRQLQTRLSKNDARVTVPFGREIAGQIPKDVAVTMRRDFPRLLDLIRAHALLHQATRSRDREARIVATLNDYEVVVGLASDVIAVGAQTCVSPTERETVAAVAALIGSNVKNVSAKNVGDEIGLDKSAAHRRVGRAVEKGYLKNLEVRRGRPARLVLGEPLPATNGVLPTVQSLRRAIEGTGSAVGCNQIVTQNQSDSWVGRRVATKTKGEAQPPELELPDFLKRTKHEKDDKHA